MDPIDSSFDQPDALLPLRAGMTQIVVAHAYGVPLDVIRDVKRGERSVAQARQIAMYLAHVVFAMDLASVARGFGRKRSTATYAIQRVEAMREDPEVNRTLGWLEATLRLVAERRP
ncbi:MAG TPA: helix-turn-helix domain-containing protein [Rhizomicrobium sp.]|jgi:chromosomal replication initiation ATPase DnaA|nr:helix-turn-helix domain-containing protein [Rhizomicrobium sp.]